MDNTTTLRLQAQAGLHEPSKQPWRAWLSPQRLRLVTGLILFTFVATHLLNHALGLIDFSIMQRTQDVRTGITRNLAVSAVLMLAALTHLTLGLRRFVQRRSLRMRMSEAVQLGFGLMIPILLLPHLTGTRIAHTGFGAFDDYHYVLASLWPENALRQTVLVIVVWVHGCIGIYHWLKIKPWFPRWSALLLGLAVAVPLLALGGFYTAARIRELTPAPTKALPAGDIDTLRTILAYATSAYITALGGVIVYRVGRTLLDRFRSVVRISYVGGPTVNSPPGFTLLEVSRMHGVPHPSVCGGRARCSTCQVRVIEGLDALTPASALERQVLERVGASDNMRLACQLRPNVPIRVATLLATSGGQGRERATVESFSWGAERQVTIMFADLRGFTAMSEHRLPFDVVFLLNQFLGPMGRVIEDHNGYVDKFMGDGIMAIFGKERSGNAGALDALAAAKGMGGVLKALNAALAHDLKTPLSIGIGLNTGPAVLGHIGTTSDSPVQRITAIGDTVNTASRLESACKELGVQLVLSQATAEAAGVDLSDVAVPREVSLRGKSGTVTVLAVAQAVDLHLPEHTTAAR